MTEQLQRLLSRTWWQYTPGASWFTEPYHWFNVAEGCFWLLLALLVLRRYLRDHRSVLELFYAAAFATFAISDFREAYVLTTWLILFKGVNLVALLLLRRTVLRRYYPGSIA